MNIEYEPSIGEIRAFRDQTECGLHEARRAVCKQKIFDAVEVYKNRGIEPIASQDFGKFVEALLRIL